MLILKEQLVIKSNIKNQISKTQCKKSKIFGFWSLIFSFERNQQGQSLIEILIALGIFVIAIAAAFMLFGGGQSLFVDSINAQIALDYANEGIEAVRSIRNRDWNELINGEHGLIFNNGQWQFSGISDSRDIFTRQAVISTIDSNTKKIIVTVNWQTNPGRLQKIELIEQLSNWKSVMAGGCKSDPLSGDWTRPRLIGSADLGPGVSGTDVVVNLPYVYVSGVSSTSSKPDIFVFDVSNPISPVLLNSLDIGSGGIESLFLQGDYLYAASRNNSKELIIFSNASNPINLAEIGSYNLSGSTDAISIITFASTTAIGRLDSAAYEITFLNVSNPLNPTVISQIATRGDVNDFYVNQTNLYAVSEESDEDIWIFDITNPLNPSLVNTYDIPGITEDLSIYVQAKNGINLLVGNEQNELITLGATTTNQIYVRDRINLGGDVNNIVCVAGDLVFLSTGNSNKEFIIVNASNPDDLVEYASLNFPQVATGIDYDENKVFISVRSNDALKIITSQ